jgi:pimeloyl-ACP methyl ester carboxylesterase
MMRYLEAGKGWPVVLLHAFPLSAEMWRPQLDRVPDGWRFIAPELSRCEATDVAGFARTVHALLDELAIDTAVIGGLSFGGYIALAMYRLEPERFSGIVLADTRPQGDTPEGRRGREDMRQALATLGVGTIADQMLPKLLSLRSRENERLVASVHAVMDAVPPAFVDDALQAMMTRPDSTELLVTIACPALVIVGAEDSVTPPDVAADMQARLSRSTLVTIPGAGHLSNLESPEEFSTALENFLRAHL